MIPNQLPILIQNYKISSVIKLHCHLQHLKNLQSTVVNNEIQDAMIQYKSTAVGWS